MLKDLVLRVLNQTVGEYFENIDASQLQLSVFSGNLALHDLILKRNICESLGLPFRVIAGRLAKLIVKIPWTGLTSYPVEVVVQDLFLLIVPGSSLPYDAETEEKARFRLKLQLLENIEAAQKELASNAKASELSEPGYFEKLAIQIVRNLQLRMESIHIRYEDEETNLNKSFAIGAVLNKLSILTTDGDWVPHYVNDSTATVYKLTTLEGFGLYWDCNSCMVSKTEEEMGARVDRLKEMLENGKFDYMMGPISIVTKLELNVLPEKGRAPFASPKVLLNTVMEELMIGISNLQFQDMLYMAAAWEGLYRRECYRKYRPHNKSYKGNYPLWWKFAFDCIMEDIQRKRNNWRWIRMRHHRRDCKDYHMALYTKNILKRSTPALEVEIEELENRLDIFNILLIRKQTEVCRERQEKIELKLRREQSWCAWLKSLIGISSTRPPEMMIKEMAKKKHSRTSSTTSTTTEEPLLTPEIEMSLEEKRSLLSAIGYSFSTEAVKKPVIHSPPEYVEAHLDFRLDKLKIIITQDDRAWNVRRSMSEGPKSTILDLQITRCQLSLDSRPENHGIKLNCSLESMDIYGGDAPEVIHERNNNNTNNNHHHQEGGNCGCTIIPHIIAPRKLHCGHNFLDLIFEKAPLESDFDQRLWIHGHPLDITYDSATIEKLAACFSLPEHVALERLQSKALLTYTNLKAQSSNSLTRMITGGQDSFELDIHIEAPCLIIPQTCFSASILSVTVVELGELIITSQLLQI